jgi:hypothetical protein
MKCRPITLIFAIFCGYSSGTSVSFDSIREELHALHSQARTSTSSSQVSPGQATAAAARTRSKALFAARHSQLVDLVRSGTDSDLAAAFRESAALGESLAAVAGEDIEKREKS